MIDPVIEEETGSQEQGSANEKPTLGDSGAVSPRPRRDGEQADGPEGQGQDDEDEYEWAIDLSKTEPYWKGESSLDFSETARRNRIFQPRRASERFLSPSRTLVSSLSFLCLSLTQIVLTFFLSLLVSFNPLGWFTGLSRKFLNCRTAKLLILAGTDRLDKELLIGQMQGRLSSPSLSLSFTRSHALSLSRLLSVDALSLFSRAHFHGLLFSANKHQANINSKCSPKLVTACTR